MSEGSFARNHLEKYGWETGKGLGRTETGITDAIKPKLKFDTAGIGHDAGEQFSFHWWDHVFNKAAKNIHVENSEEGVKVKQKGTKSNLISNKRSTHENKTKPLLYGSFVKHGTLADGAISQDKECSSSPSSDESDDDKPLETYEGNDEMLFKACGGRTAHKGARHGLHLSGKLQRIEEQESLHSNMMKMRNGSKATPTTEEMEREEDGLTVEKRKRRKHKKGNKEINECDELMETVESPEVMDRLEVHNADDTVPERKKNKKKKRSKHSEEATSLDSRLDGHEEEVDKSSSLLDDKLIIGDDVILGATNTGKKKSKKTKKAKEGMKVQIDEEESQILEVSAEVQDESTLVDEWTRKKKSKKEKRRVEIEVESANTVEVEDKSSIRKEKKDRKRKKRKDRAVANECISNEHEKEKEVESDEELIPKKKKKDRKKDGKRHIKEEDEENVKSASNSQGGDICQGDTVSKSASKKKKTRKSISTL